MQLLMLVVGCLNLHSRVEEDIGRSSQGWACGDCARWCCSGESKYAVLLHPVDRGDSMV
jgi:hypothetical protein